MVSKIKKIIVSLSLICFFLSSFSLPAQALSEEFSQPIKAASIDGAAPLHYRNSKGEITGIAIKVMEEIANNTGLQFEYELYDNISDVRASDARVIFGMTQEYAYEGITLSDPYLLSETILFYNASLDPRELTQKRHAAINGVSLPEGLRKYRHYS